MSGADIVFPHLGISIANLPKGITIGNFTIAYYGIIIALGMLGGLLLAAGRQSARGRIRSSIWIMRYGGFYLPLSGRVYIMWRLAGTIIKIIYGRF